MYVYIYVVSYTYMYLILASAGLNVDFELLATGVSEVVFSSPFIVSIMSTACIDVMFLDDSILEEDETFDVTFTTASVASTPPGITIGSPMTTVVTILDDGMSMLYISIQKKGYTSY